jgi:hypothetical protein
MGSTIVTEMGCITLFLQGFSGHPAFCTGSHVEQYTTPFTPQGIPTTKLMRFLAMPFYLHHPFDNP